MKQRKYKNTKIEIDGFSFDSKKEGEYYQKLRILESKGIIKGLLMQVTFILIASQKLSNGKTERPVTYIADFVYTENGKEYVIDVKSPMTRKLPAYVIKRKLMKFIHNKEIHEC